VTRGKWTNLLEHPWLILRENGARLKGVKAETQSRRRGREWNERVTGDLTLSHYV